MDGGYSPVKPLLARNGTGGAAVLICRSAEAAAVGSRIENSMPAGHVKYGLLPPPAARRGRFWLNRYGFLRESSLHRMPPLPTVLGFLWGMRVSGIEDR